MNNEKHRYNELADFLKTRRAKILPSQVGLAAGTRRRTPGLRREEVAQLAGIGLTWYTWLEQGRSIQVSAQVVESLSKVLLLDKQERFHFYLLANQPLPAEIPECQETVSPALQHVLDSLILCPSFIMDQRWNAIAWNKAACAIFGDYNVMSVRERNVVWAMLTDKKYRQLFVDWELHAQKMLGRFRATLGQYIADPWLVQFIEDLKGQSAEFNLWWSLHEIQSNGENYKQLNHPLAGRLDFEISNFDVSDQANLKLIVHVPRAETETAAKMKALLGM